MENSQTSDFIDPDESSVDETETTDSLEQSDDLIDNGDTPSAPVVSLDSQFMNMLRCLKMCNAGYMKLWLTSQVSNSNYKT